MLEHDEDVENILQRQDEAMALLERLRAAEPAGRGEPESPGGGRRQFRRWPTPPGVSLDLHDGERWHPVDCSDMGVGGARVTLLPAWVKGPSPARLKASKAPAVLVLSDIMWRDGSGAAGLGFDFLDREDHELWATSLIDALLAQYSLA
jgi:hypothetical protein